MPRVARRKDAGTANSPLWSPKSIPLNDDHYEKAARFQSRQALQEQQLNQIRAAASPGHRRAQYDHIAKDDTGIEGGETESDKNERVLTASSTNVMTAMKRVPILANFEEWMKMATDNKINATNSWNFALIDYFHDMSLLKEGDGVNFQKASCTLDGCVKIYTSRVDSVATETGKLLSGLADSGNKDRSSASEEEEEDDDENEEGEGGGKRKAKRKARSSETTLATSFSQLQLKKFELEFSVDPLFKKASADFDEGGAKGLLLNHLCIDSNGRIIFDSSDDTEEHQIDDNEDTNAKSCDSTVAGSNIETSQQFLEGMNLEIELDDLRANFLPDLSILDDQDVCPSLKTLEIGETMDLAGLSILQDHKKRDDRDIFRNPEIDEAGLLGLNSDDTNLGFEPEFGAGGEAWAHEAGLEPLIGAGGHLSSHGATQDDPDGEDEFESKAGSFDVKMQFGPKKSAHPDIFGYFDHSMKANWAGPEHWRIRKMKRDLIPRDGPRRKEKEPFEVDFQSSMAQKLAEQIYTSSSSNSAISLPKSQWRSRTRHLLPDDKHFSSTHLLRLFLKPKARLGRRGGRHTKCLLADQYEIRHLDDAFWAQKHESSNFTSKADFDAEFFQEDDGTFPLGILEDDADEFTDARERFSPAFGQEEQTATLSVIGTDINGDSEGGYGTSLVTKSRRLRPEYVSYAKVAKKVDVRLLKEKMWKGIGFEESSAKTQKAEAINETQESTLGEKSLNFTLVMNNLQHVYAPEAMAEISTSYCFISLLHLANEKGLILNNNESLEDLSIRRDSSAEISAAA